MEPLKVLQFTIGGPEFTGIASFLYQYYQNINKDLVQYDFVFARQNSMKMVADDPIFRDASFIELNAVNSSNGVDYRKLMKGIGKVLSEKKYDIFHINTHRVGVTMACIAAAKRKKVKTVISHSHNVRLFVEGKSRKRRIADAVKELCAIYIRKNCDYLFACSESAGEALFGREGIKRDNFRVIRNAINSADYTFDNARRDRVRLNEVRDDNRKILGQVGRLSLQKNQSFSLEVLHELLKRDDRYDLWLVGDGADLEALKQKANELKVSEHVKFWGQRTDVADLMQAMDGFLLPSTYEGLGIVAIEAQAAGLPTYASAMIPKETKITDLISYLPLSDGPEKWADYIVHDIGSHTRRDTHQEIIDSGYDIKAAAKWLEAFYCSTRQDR